MFNTNNSDEEHWLSISDLMSGLMLVFLFIAVAYMLAVFEEKSRVEQGQLRIKEIVVTYEEAQLALYHKLLEEFKDDLPKWQATLDKQTLAIKFFEPEVLFQTGKADVTPKFKAILDDFFPRYLNIIFSDEFASSIEEIRIEGHTSSEWNIGFLDADKAYFKNMELSQQRTLSVLEYCYSLPSHQDMQEKMKKYITANGLSSSKPILDCENKEDKKASRRVEFRTRTNAEMQIVKIIDEFRE